MSIPVGDGRVLVVSGEPVAATWDRSFSDTRIVIRENINILEKIGLPGTAL